MIVSASYRTDIPTFYGTWFMNRLRAGHCRVRSPYGGPDSVVSLDPQDVDGFVFWTKNLGPFLPHLAEVRRQGIPFVIQYTIDGYPRQLEYAVTDARRSVEHVRRVAGEYGPAVCVWRYDPIIITSLTPIEFHLANFERLAGELRGATDEVVISFAQFYKKTVRNVASAAAEHGFTWEDPRDNAKRQMIASLRSIASAAGMRLSICSQRQYLIEGVEDARCIDAERMARVAGRGRRIHARPKAHRPSCGCHESRDIGAYDTCPHGCVYCYAVRSRDAAQQRHRQHDPDGEFLFTPPAGAGPLASRQVAPLRSLRLWQGDSDGAAF